MPVLQRLKQEATTGGQPVTTWCNPVEESKREEGQEGGREVKKEEWKEG